MVQMLNCEFASAAGDVGDNVGVALVVAAAASAAAANIAAAAAAANIVAAAAAAANIAAAAAAANVAAAAADDDQGYPIAAATGVEAVKDVFAELPANDKGRAAAEADSQHSFGADWDAALEQLAAEQQLNVMSEQPEMVSPRRYWTIESTHACANQQQIMEPLHQEQVARGASQPLQLRWLLRWS